MIDAPTPKQVSEFARRYTDLYLGLVQCSSAFKLLEKERDEWKSKSERLEKELNDLKK